ncbi:Sensor histidine kinase YpdA [Koleobacter methoxysyntrophicus]|uniref:Sensor histidine kinase YpdA n=1 Tax=Koleobacter methoxysyntrophicus TaxID=2751313 RepID=A0A8A0RLG6_9FIRM|nr:PocR ligand-binding domain-containing protein [Koleobacter methoxysyntrophicus]QSQ08066.1 Sensor histidine kinase YpdA [Koleobacter methoxysyntrophicus]
MLQHSLLRLIEQDRLRKLIESFTRATDITIDINDCLGYPVVYHECFYGFCKKVRSTKKGLKKCIESNADIGFKTKERRKAFIGPCFAGIALMGVPIVVDKAFHGSIVCGQFHLKPPTEKMISKMLSAMDEIGLNGHEMIEDFKNIKVIPKEKCKAVSELIEFIANYIAEIIYKNKIENELIRQKLRVMETNQTRVELEKALWISELKKLQSQIKPHFLFNTLNIISRLIIMNENHKALDTVYALSNIMRSSFEESDELISLEKEMDYVKNYLSIQKMRFGERLRFKIEIDDRLRGISIPALTIQPLVENACTHGIEPKEDLGEIIIQSQLAGNDVIIKIIDNGIGIPEEKLKEIHMYLTNDKDFYVASELDGSLGLKNVHRRLQLYFGSEYGLSITSRTGCTQVSVKLPYNS